MNKIGWISLVLISGALLPVQAALNAKLGKASGSAVAASTISFVIGTVFLLVYLLVSKQSINYTALKQVPWLTWTGGLIGAFYVTIIVMALPALGPGLAFGLIIAGQMIISLLLEHFSLLVSVATPISPTRILGAVLLIIGVVLIRR